MDVYLFMDLAPNKRGPVELQVLEMCRQSQDLGISLRFFFSGPPADWFMEELLAAGYTAERFSRNGPEKIVEFCRSHSPEIVHFHFGSQFHVANRLRAMGIHVIRSEHSYRSSGWWTPAASVRRHWRARGVSDFIAVSHYIARQTRRDFLVSSRRITTIYNGTDLQRFQPGNAMDATSARRDLGLDAGPVVSMVAHLHHAKRQLLLLEAMKVIWKRDPRVQLVLAGGGPDESMLRAASSAAGGPVKLFTGNNDVAQIYHASDLAVLPSTGEGLPGSAIEALACGVPVVVTAAGGLGEVPTHGVSGLIVDGATPESLGAAIEALLGDERLRTWMSGEARKRAIEVFDIRRTARETLEFYSTRSPRD